MRAQTIHALCAAALLAGAALLTACAQKDTGKPAKLLEQGWEYYRSGEYSPALKAFERAHRLGKGNAELELKSLYALATVWNLRRPDNNLEKARAYYQAILTNAPRHELAAWSMLALARMIHVIPSEQKPDYPAIRQAYQKVIDAFPAHPAADEAFLYQQSTYLASLKAPDAALALSNLSAYLAKYPATRMRSPLYGLISSCHSALGNAEARLAADIESMKTRELDPTNPRANLAWNVWSIANLAEFEAGDFKTAREYYQRFLKEYPDDNKTYAAKVALERLDATEARIRAGKLP